MNRIVEKIILGLVGLFLLIYVIYQAYIFMYGSMKTETLFDYTVSRAIPVKGVAIRSEHVLDGDYGSVPHYIFEDGTRVSKNESVAEFFENSQSDRNVRRARQLEAEINMLIEAQDETVNNFSTTEILNRDIKEQLFYLSGLSNDGRYSNVDDVKDRLTECINKKQVATGMATSFEPRINSLRAEYDSLHVAEESTAVTFLKTPESGYFSKSVDGREDELTPLSVKDFTIHDYLSAIDKETAAPQNNSYGKIVTDQNWIFACSAPKESLEFVTPGQEVSLKFESAGKEIPAVIADIMQEKDEELAVLIINCNQVSGELLEIRNAEAVINFNQYMGLRVNMSDVRFQGDKRGVYVLEKNTVCFRELDPIYEEQSFVLSRLIQPNSQETRYVRLFDQIITKGNDLYDGKVIL